ncbi:hypothetical protein SAMN04487905_10895 [Actinopolyspora xinjiangensis]|uniref:Phosphotransferase enzyme family protein n=1 Tax=Actinopolyspora xinjiangensis TaxID=405564 RepID=A0A1H0V8Z9_9ACTN|nr:class V lanthionine synthetase subunit LxmK [Actinopolyspora xinjiangensis]SDP74920.1 hypothetical protein SAMN04487905_10895 [Actinopolyspora xinjiangensis]
MRIDSRVDEFLTAHQLGRVRPETVKEQNGRNANFLVVTTTDTPLFIKTVRGSGAESRERFAACTAFETLRRENTTIRSELGTAPLLASDREHGFLAYEAVAGASSLAELAREEPENAESARSSVADHAWALGRILAAVHALDVERVPERTEPLHMPPVAFLDALPWKLYRQASASVLRVWNRLQRDEEVADALRVLQRDEAAATPTAIHGDFRLDQLLLGHDEVLRLVDIEEFRRGDPARDVGSMVGEWLHRAALDIVTDRSGAAGAAAGAAAAELELDHEDVVAGGTAALDRQRPVITRFWESYWAARGDTATPEFVRRAARFAGWHMFDRLLAVAEYVPRVSAVHWAAAGIGRQALLNPGDAAPALGLPSLSDAELSPSGRTSALPTASEEPVA